jgi:hypothetical protein
VARAALAKAQADMRPCSLDRAIELLTPNLILCAPSGMSNDDRHEWYKAALSTIGDIPADLLERACVAARKVCDHPAKIVPFICSHEPELLKWRRENLHRATKIMENIEAPRIEKSDPNYMTAADLAELKADLADNLRA